MLIYIKYLGCFRQSRNDSKLAFTSDKGGLSLVVGIVIEQLTRVQLKDNFGIKKAIFLDKR